MLAFRQLRSDVRKSELIALAASALALALMWHSGQIGGFTAEEGVFLDDGFTVVVLTNDQDYNTDPITIKLIDAVCGSPQLAGDC